MAENPAPPKEESKPSLNAASEEDKQNENENANSAPVVLPNQPRPARDLRGLMRFAMEATGMVEVAAASSAPAGPTPMNEVDRAFLQEALKSMTVDLIKVIGSAIKKLRSIKDLRADDDLEEYEEALDTVSNLVDTVDVANDFLKVGGLDILVPCLTCPHTSLQWRTAHLIGELSQNNPFCQKRILAVGVLPSLLELVDNGATDIVRVKAFFALSCLVRDNLEIHPKFSELDGFSVVLRAMQSDIEKLRIKAAFFLTALCSQHPAIRDELQKMGYVQQLVGLISDEPSRSHEHLLSALLGMIRDHPQCIEDCRDPKLQLRTMLTSHLELVKGKEECRDEIDFAQQIIAIVFSDDGAGEER